MNVERTEDARQSSHKARDALREKYRTQIQINPALARSLVSYQSNRNRPYYRWLKYKEGFSASLIEYVLGRMSPKPKALLDPFAGSGAALFVGRDLGCLSEGIELLPVGTFAIRARLAAESVRLSEFRAEVDRFRASDWRKESGSSVAYHHLKITEGAFSAQTENDLARFRSYLQEQIKNANVRMLFDFACLGILEDVSFTRKDGQYLRWDERAPRDRKGKRFSKGSIRPFERAIQKKLELMIQDLVTTNDLFPAKQENEEGRISVREGSSLALLPTIPSGSFDIVITSPPYCNRYDYTRTYALELAYLGVDEVRLKDLRQALLSCTVENRSKLEELRQQYEGRSGSDLLDQALSAFDEQEALHEVLAILERKANQGLLNNINVPRMVRNYFLESAVVVFELARVLRRNGHVVMVNDNVQYAGEEVPVDLILSDFAAKAGFRVEHIWTLSRGKGNSSQQMGAHGRKELRKCAYVWRLDS